MVDNEEAEDRSGICGQRTGATVAQYEEAKDGKLPRLQAEEEVTRYFLIECANCGHQTMVDLDTEGDTCLFCGKDARKKEVIMQDNKRSEPVPTKPKNRKKLKDYWEKNKEAMVADYLSMRVSSFFRKWGISSKTWQGLREKWEIPSKTKDRGSQSTEKPTTKAAKEAKNEDVALTEHERYLILLGYQQAVREIFGAK